MFDKVKKGPIIIASSKEIFVKGLWLLNDKKVSLSNFSFKDFCY